MRIHFAFDGPFDVVRDELNAVHATVVGKTDDQSRITRELLYHVVTECVDAAQAEWLLHRDTRIPKPIVRGTVDVTVTYSQVNP